MTQARAIEAMKRESLLTFAIAQLTSFQGMLLNPRNAGWSL